MNQRVEYTKTALLWVLVLTSIVLSGLLWNDTPVSLELDPATTSFNPAVGPDKLPQQVVLPPELILHLGDDRHVRLGPFADGYGDTLNLLAKVSVTEWTPVDFTDDVWKKISSGKAITLRCSLPPSVDHTEHATGLLLPPNVQQVTALHYYREGSDLKVLLLSDTHAYVGKALLAVDIASWIDKYAKLPPFSQYGSRLNPYYLPAEPMQVQEEAFTRKSFGERQLVESYFVDPSLIRSIKEQRGTVIYTDGVRGVQVDASTKQVTYTDSSLQQVDKTGGAPVEFDKGLKDVLDFTRNHGGLSGNFIASVGINSTKSAGDALDNSTSFRFRKYIDGYPVFDPLASVKVKIRPDGVDQMSRSLAYLGQIEESKNNLTLLPGAKLWLAIESQGVSKNDISFMEMVWHPVREGTGADSRILLYPVWEIHTGNQLLLLNAVTGSVWTDTPGWLDGLE